MAKRKSNVLLVLVMALIAMFSCYFGVSTLNDNKTAKASAETVDYNDLLGLEDRTSWGAHEGEYYFGGVTLEPFGYFNTADSVSSTWYVGNDSVITANNGVDIMEYIYVNGTSARSLITANANGDRLGNSCGCWLSNPAACPVYVETTNGSGILIKLLKSHVGETFTLTFKAGFSLIRNDNAVISLTDDIRYDCVASGNNVALTRTRLQKYTLSFEGLDETETKTVLGGTAIGELPAVPAKDGYVGFWTLDGKRIDKDSTISANATATPAYALEYENLIALEDRTSWGAHEGEYYFGGFDLGAQDNPDTEVGEHYFNTADSVCGTWYHGNTAPITANNGVDILEYIYVNGVSARKLITDNVNGDNVKNSCDCWLSNPAASPVYVDTTNGSGIIIRLLKSYFGDTVTLTFKAGFSLIRNDGETIYVSNDVTYTYENGTLTDNSRVNVTFDGENMQIVYIGKKAVCPATVPTKEGTESHTYTFDGWYNFDTKWNFDDPVEAHMALVSKFIETEKAKYSVTFNADNGASDTSVSVYENSYVKEDQIPADPEKAADGDAAYTFLYWSLDGENAYDFSTPVTQDITLTAVYTTKPLYTVTLGDEIVKVVEGGKIEKPADPTKESTAELDYTFEGWYNGDAKWDFENDTVTGDLTLVAKYTESTRKYTVSFNVTGNDNFKLDSVTVEYGTTYDLSALFDDVDATAYTYTVTVDGVAVTSVEVLSDVTVDVAFTARVYYTVTIDGVEQIVEQGEKVTKPATEPTKASTAEFDYTFDGWYNGDTKWDFENDTVTSDLTLVAKYTESTRKYTISFNVTGNDNVKLDSVEVEYGTTYDLSKLLDDVDVSGYTYSISVDGVEKISIKVIGDTTVTVAFTKLADNNDNTNSSTDSTDSSTDDTDSSNGIIDSLMGYVDSLKETVGSLTGCQGSITSATGVILGVIALGVVAIMKKKED